MDITLKKPDFKKEWEDALRFREFEKMGFDKWLESAEKNHEVVDYSTIKDKLSNVNLDFDTLQNNKKDNFLKNIKKGEMEMPIAVKFNDNDIKLIGGNTRLAGLLSKNADPKIWVVNLTNNKKEMKEEMKELIKGGLADNKSIEAIAKKHNKSVSFIEDQIKKGIKVEFEHTNDRNKAREIAKDHLFEIPDYYTRLDKMEKEAGEGKEKEIDEVTGAASSGQYTGPLGGKPIKKPITILHNMTVNEVLDSAVSAGSQYDVPFGGGPKGRRDPLKIDGPKSIGKSRAVKDKNFPKFGGPKGVYIKIKEKCKKFPYCNQGDLNNIQVMNEAINQVSKEQNVPVEKIKKLVLNEIRRIFINEYENQRDK